MALHFVQVEQEFIDQDAGTVAELLRIPLDVAIGKSVRAWSWSLKNAAPDGIARAPGAATALEAHVGWTGKRGAFVEALVRAGALERSPEGLRFRGWSNRYGKVLTQQEKDRLKKRKQRGLSLGTSPGTSSGGVRPETGDVRPETEDLKPPPPDPAAAVFDEGPDVVDPSTGDGFWRWVQKFRRRGGLTAELVRPKDFARWVAWALARYGPAAMCEAYQRFAGDPYWESRGWPTAIFITDGVFLVRVSEKAVAHG